MIFALIWPAVYSVSLMLSTAVVLVKNVLFLVPPGKVLELDFAVCFLIKAGLSVEILFLFKKIWEMTKNLGAHPAWLLTLKRVGGGSI